MLQEYIKSIKEILKRLSKGKGQLKEYDKMIEMDKLETYLKRSGIKYHRIHMPLCISEEGFICGERNQIIVYGEDEKRQWDAICHKGSYGYEDGLLEIMGNIVRDDETVEGWLTAADVIERIENDNTGNI